MQFSTVLAIFTSAFAVTGVTALPGKNTPPHAEACGSSICSGAVSTGNADCTLSCHWGPCESFTCSDGSSMVCGTNRDSCTLA